MNEQRKRPANDAGVADANSASPTARVHNGNCIPKKIYVGKQLYATVDDADYPRLVTHSWFIASGGYACRVRRTPAIKSGRDKHVKMHREVLGLEYGDTVMVDHINGDRLDNRRANLRICDASQNQWNRHKKASGCTSQYRGVHRYGSRWRARIACRYHVYNLGTFSTERQAALAYNRAAKKLFGEFASPNTMSKRG